MRHGEVQKKYQHCYNGHIDIGLSKNGIKQAKELAKKFQYEKYDAVFCSDLKRAKQTLSYFPHAKNAIYTDQLREKYWGKHEGMKFEEIISKGEIKYENFSQWIDALGGESYQSFIKRVEDFFTHYLPLQKKQNILVITHAGVIKTFISIIDKIPLEEAFSIKLPYSSHITFKIE